MNLLFVYYLPSGGVETLNRQRSTALQKASINVHFLYYETRRPLINDHNAPLFITKDDQQMKEIIEQGEYDAIVVVSDFKALEKIRQLGYKGKLIIEIQGYGPKNVAKAELRNAYPLVTKHADAYLYPGTPHIGQILEELYPSFPIFTFNNCFDMSKYTYRPLPKEEHPIIAWIGRIEENKNWREFLLIGHELITQHNENIELYMFEDATLSRQNDRIQFQELVQKLNLEEKITLHSNIPNFKMADYFSMIGDSGGFLCSTSKVEGAPYALLEAISCKCPVLTTDSDGVRSSIIHNQTGKYYTLGNIDEAVKEAIELMTNLTLREQIRMNALGHLKTHFSPGLYCQHFTSMLKKLGV